MKRIAALILAGIATLIFTACSNQLNDMEAIPQKAPDYVVTYLNVDNFPNVTLLCIKGIGFATTTRDLNSLERIPEWDAFCATKVKP